MGLTVPHTELSQRPNARLRLISCRGVAIDVPVALNQQILALDAVCDLSPISVPEETRAALRQCQVTSVQGPAGAQWWLRNLDCNVHCTVNSVRLAAGEGLYLQDGDVIELGLVQIGFQVREPDLRMALEAEPSHASDVKVPSAADAQGQANVLAFQLTDLNQLAEASSWHAQTQRLAHDPFADILDAVDGQKSTAYNGHSSAATEPLQVPMDFAASTNGSASFSAPHPPSVGSDQAAQGTLWAAPMPASVGVMDALHRQYLRLMQDPNDLQLASNWDAQAERITPKAPSFNELMHQTAHHDIYDILGHSASIEPILAQLDTLSGTNILQTPAHVDVLRLFAPAHHQGVEAGLPSLTRRDHHGVTADSAMQLDGGVSGSTPTSATPVSDPSSKSKPRP